MATVVAFFWSGFSAYLCRTHYPNWIFLTIALNMGIEN